MGTEEAFIYTTILPVQEIKLGHYSSPFFLQEGLIPKIDIRVTIIDREVIAVKIEADSGIDIDWRKYKGELRYSLFALPVEIKNKCIELTKSLKLIFSAIDLVLHNNVYYFIELNPTGEWLWLQNNTNYPFDEIITQNLIQ